MWLMLADIQLQLGLPKCFHYSIPSYRTLYLPNPLFRAMANEQEEERARIEAGYEGAESPGLDSQGSEVQ